MENLSGDGASLTDRQNAPMKLRVPVRRPPVVVQIGLNIHGRLARERYRMPGLWGVHLYHYAGSVEFAGRSFPFTPGCVSVTPPDTELIWRFPAHAPHHYALMRFPGETQSDALELPVITDLGGAIAGHAEAVTIDRVVAAFDHEPQRAHAWAWDLLWRLAPVSGVAKTVAGIPGVTSATVPPALQIVLTMIDLELDLPHSLAGLAKRSGISANQLLRLFHKHCGNTVMGWIRQRRALRARELLTSSSLPITDIAKAVGCADLQALNKLVRRAYAISPRALRGS